MKHAKRHPLIFGTIILTATGLITRVIGFSTVSICPGSSVKREWASISCSVRHYPYLFPYSRRISDRHFEICGGG